MPGIPDDMMIITEVLNGDSDAFRHLLDRYEARVARLVAAHVPGDSVAEVSHDTFIRAYKSLAGYKPIKPFGNWLTTIATRSCHDFWRDRYRSREVPACDMSENGQRFIENALAADSVEAFEAIARQREAREILSLVLDQLSPLDRMVLTMTYLEEQTVKDSAEMLGISASNVKIRSFRAKRKLRSFLKRHGIQGG